MHLPKRDERAQMLLATGVVLMMSLLSMAIFTIKVAGITIPHEPNSNGVLDASSDVVEVFPDLIQARAEVWLDAGASMEEALDNSLQESERDLMHHGELRGVEVKLMQLSYTIDSNDSSLVYVTGSLGVSDDDVRMEIPLNLTLEFA